MQVATQVRDEQIRLLYQHGVVAFIVNGAVAALLVLLIGPHVERNGLVAWCALFAVTWALRGALHLWRKLRLDAMTPENWVRVFAAGTFLAGTSWGMAAVWFFPASADHRLMLAAAIMGLASGAAASLSCVRWIYSLYLIPAFLPVAVRYAFENGNDGLVIFVLALLYCAGMSVAAEMNYRQITNALALRFQNAELAGRLDDLASHDPLTGLANRRMLSDRLEAALRRSKRSNELLAVAFIDCDDFKQINDVHGHDAGDEFLKEIADALLRCVRETDTVARLGGDEFIVLLESVADRGAVEVVVRRMEACVEQKLSIGLAVYPDDGVDAETLIRFADQAMYRAKSLTKSKGR